VTNREKIEELDGYEIFCDESYYQLWAIRKKGTTRLDETLHAPSEQEAKNIVSALADLEGENRRLREALEEKEESAPMTITRFVIIFLDPNKGPMYVSASTLGKHQLKLENIPFFWTEEEAAEAAELAKIQAEEQWGACPEFRCVPVELPDPMALWNRSSRALSTTEGGSK
jgi:hypothetical protein